MRQVIRALVGETMSLSVPLATLDDRSDLYEAGMSSFEMVSLLVALEKRFNISFPLEAMVRETFSSIASICEAVAAADRDQTP